MTSSQPDGLPARYFDGRSACSVAVRLTCAGDVLQLRGEDVTRDEPLRSLRVSESLGRAPRMITFADGAHCEVEDLPALEAFLRNAGHGDSLVVAWQFSWPGVVVALALLLGMLAAAFQWGLPWIAREGAARMPETLLLRIGDDTLRMLDEAVLQPSSVPAPRQQALARRFAAMTGNATPLTIVHRRGGRLGANALALPSGTVVVTDELLALAENDEEVLGVLAHELGHVRLRHGMRMVLENSVGGLLLAWYVGDVGTVVAGVPAALMQARYSRAFETEADDFAVSFLAANGLPASPLADMLERLEASQIASKAQDGNADRGPLAYFDSHPATAGRIRRLRGLAPD